MNIEYYIKNVYGNECRYILDEKIANIISGLTGQKTLLIRHMDLLEDLGFTFTQVLPPKQ